MSENVYWVLEVTIQPDRFDDLKALVSAMVEATKSNEPGTLNYEWSISADRSVSTVYERYEDSAAVLTHMGSFNAHFAAQFLALVKPAGFVVYGAPSPAVKDVLSGLNPVYMSPFDGFKR
jgi:quinol monooxygenase YgiN